MPKQHTWLQICQIPCTFGQVFHLQVFFLVLVSMLHTELLDDLFPSPNIIRLLKSTRMSWTEHVARMEVYRVGKREGKKAL